MTRKVHFYKLPLELLMLVLDDLSLRDILNLCSDPAFPAERIPKKYLIDPKTGISILHLIAEIGWKHASAIKKFIHTLGPLWDSPSWMNKTPLAISAQTKHIKLCRLFLRAGANVNPFKGTSPLFCAVGSAGNDKVIALLLKNGADISWKGNSGIGIFHLAVEHSNLNTVELFLHSGADPNELSSSGVPLNHAKDPVTAKMLIDHGADVNCDNDKHCASCPPLITALEDNNSELVKVLLEAGANANVCDDSNCSALYNAINRSRGETRNIEMLISAGCDVSRRPTGQKFPPVLFAAVKKFQLIVQTLIEAGADVVNSKDDDGLNVVFGAAYQSSPTILKMLIDAGGDVNGQDKNLRTPLFKAIEASNGGNVKVLLDANADGSHSDITGIQPAILVVAASYTFLFDIHRDFTHSHIKWISECEYLIHEEDEELENHISILRHLLAHDVNVSDVQFKGIGILHFAAWRNDKELVKLLLDGGANALFKDPDGNTAADWAAELAIETEDVEIEHLLRAAEAAQLTRGRLESYEIV